MGGSEEKMFFDLVLVTRLGDLPAHNNVISVAV